MMFPSFFDIQHFLIICAFGKLVCGKMISSNQHYFPIRILQKDSDTVMFTQQYSLKVLSLLFLMVNINFSNADEFDCIIALDDNFNVINALFKKKQKKQNYFHQSSVISDKSKLKTVFWWQCCHWEVSWNFHPQKYHKCCSEIQTCGWYSS